jgi:chemosensory pili system protein ChpA (sensor histidine kinase/response regulator)
MEAMAQYIHSIFLSTHKTKKLELNKIPYEILMRSLLQLPGYLERIEKGEKDNPLILLPLINELRKALKQSLLDESEVFKPKVEYQSLSKPLSEISNQKNKNYFQENVKKLRIHFQRGLTDVLRGKKVRDGLAKIHNVLIRLEALTEGESLALLWWVADGFIFAIAENGLYKKQKTHQLLSLIDKQIKPLAEKGEEALSNQIPKELLSKLLFFIANSTSKSTRILNLKEEFNLDALSPSAQLTEQQNKLKKPDSHAMLDVLNEISEEIQKVKDSLDLFVRSKIKDHLQVEAIIQPLTMIKDTLTLLEMPIPRDVIEKQLITIKKTLSQSNLPNDQMIMDLAGALLFVESNLSNIDDQLEYKKTNNTIESITHSKHQVCDASEVLIRVARKNIQLIKEALINYIASLFKSEKLDKIPAILNEVLGALKIIQLDDVIELLALAKQFIEEKLLFSSTKPENHYFDALADIISSVDYYLENIEEKGETIPNLLKNSCVSQKLLQDYLESTHHTIKINNENIESIPIIEALDENTLISNNDPLLNTRDMEDTLDLDIQKSELSDEKTKKMDHERLSSKENLENNQLIPKNEPSNEPLLPESISKDIDESLIDDEVLEIFLEELLEEIEAIEYELPRWISNTNNFSSRSTIRRSFHTLKGSGRLVGAQEIGELCWAIEIC